MAATQAVLAGALCAKFPPVTLQHPSSALLDAAASPEAGSPAAAEGIDRPGGGRPQTGAHLPSEPQARAAPSLKADAYGLGVLQIAPSLARAGCSAYFVALPQEGLALRSLLPSATIYVLNGVFEDVREAVAARLVPFVSSMEALAEWPGQAPFALNVDTGMNRLGLAPDEAISVRERRPTLLASHFACADTPSHPLNARQEAAFAALREAFPETPASFANSAALLTRPQAHYDLVRPGIALYGGASAGPATALEPTAKLEARVIQVRHVPAGDPVGYGAAQSVRRPTRLAIALAGLRRRLPSRGRRRRRRPWRAGLRERHDDPPRRPRLHGSRRPSTSPMRDAGAATGSSSSVPTSHSTRRRRLPGPSATSFSRGSRVVPNAATAPL